MPVASRLLAPLAVCVLLASPQVPRADAQTRNIYVSVVDNRGAAVEGLTADDFVVREDGVAREVLNARQAEEPIQLALLIDNSQAATDAVSRLREGLSAFLERVHGRAEITLITVGERSGVLEPFTSDTALLQKRTGAIFGRPGAGAYLLDGIVDASRALARRESPRRVIVAVTFEGIDYSNRQREFVLDELAKSGAALHVIAIGRPSGSLSDEMRTRTMVIAACQERTGGRRDQVLADMGIPDRLRQAADELVLQYVVTYSTPERLIPPERVSVSTTRRNLTARAPSRLPR
jgi:Ca-activated chloride channel homolog